METKEAPEQPGTLSGKYSELWLQGWKQYLRAFGGPGTSAPATNIGTLQQRYVEFVQNEGATAFRKLSELSLNYYSAAMDVSVGFTQEFYRQVFQNGASEPPVAQEPTNPSRELVFAGPPGSSPIRAFLVANNTDKPALMSFELSEFVTEDGEEKLRVEAELTPPTFELSARGERAVQCRLPLSESFAAGRDYHAVLRVVGFPDMKVCLLARVEKGTNGALPLDPQDSA